MSIASLLEAEQIPPRRDRRRGRPPASALDAERQRHLLCASLLLLADTPGAEVASRLSLSRASVYTYTARALAYPGPLADALRSAARARGMAIGG